MEAIDICATSIHCMGGMSLKKLRVELSCLPSVRTPHWGVMELVARNYF